MKPTDTLSGGETVRLLICQLMLRGNVLVLDEPTNHLDLEASARSPRRSRGTRARPSW